MTPTPLIPTHTAGAAFDRAAALLNDLSPACPEAAWIGGHLVRALANCVEIPDFVDFDIAVPRSKLAAIEAHVLGLGWVRAAENGAVDRTPLPHRRWKTNPAYEQIGEDPIGWPHCVLVDLVIYDDTQGETLRDLVARFDLNVLHLWADRDSTPLPRGEDFIARALPRGLTLITPVVTSDAHAAVLVDDAYEALLAGDVRLVPGAWSRPWRLGKYRLALGLGPLTGETLPICRPPGTKRGALPPAGFQWIEYADLQSWRNRGPCRAPWVLGDLNAYTSAQGLHDRAVACGVAVPDSYRQADVWVVWDSADTVRTGVAALSLRNAYVVEVHPGNPEAPQPGQYVRVWDGEIRQTDPSNPTVVRIIRFPPDVFDRIVALRDLETKS